MTKREEARTAVAEAIIALDNDGLWEDYEAALDTFERTVEEEEAQACAEVAEAEWLKADNEPPGYRQSSISHGCLASAKAIRARIEGRKAALSRLRGRMEGAWRAFGDELLPPLWWKRCRTRKPREEAMKLSEQDEKDFETLVRLADRYYFSREVIIAVVARLRRKMETHVCHLPDSVNEALNSGDGRLQAMTLPPEVERDLGLLLTVVAHEQNPYALEALARLRAALESKAGGHVQNCRAQQ